MEKKKLTYDQFKEKVKTEIKSYLPEKFEEYTVSEKLVNKVNVELETLMLVPNRENNGDTDEPCCMANTYFKTYYEKYALGASFEMLIKEIAAIIKATDVISEKMKKSTEEEQIIFGECIVFQLINKERNKRLIENVPHYDVLDLTLICREVVINGNDLYSTIIDYEILRKINMTEEKLYKFALEMTKKTLKPELVAVAPPMYALSNKGLPWGAASIVYEKLLEDLANKLDCDLYLLPSSLDEIIVLPTNLPETKINDETVKELLKAGNKESITEEEWLSDNVYIYRKDEHLIDILQ